MTLVANVLRRLLAVRRQPQGEGSNPGFTATEVRKTLACLGGCAEGWDPAIPPSRPRPADRPPAAPDPLA